MSSSQPKIRRKGYHHGNLRDALVLAAKQLILEKGPHGFTLVEAAKLAGVSPGAPYRHFKDQNSLLAEVASRGFEAFVKTLDRAWCNAQPDWHTAFMRMGQAYIEFAYEEQAYYRAMFEASIDSQDHPHLQTVGAEAFGKLALAAKAIKANLPPDSDVTEEQISFHINSMSHGAATLLRRGNEAVERGDPTELLLTNVTIYLKGLGLDKGKVRF